MINALLYGCIELANILGALCSVAVFSALIYKANSLNTSCRMFLVFSALSMFAVLCSHLGIVIVYIADKENANAEKLFKYIHEGAYFLNSASSFALSLERLIITSNLRLQSSILFKLFMAFLAVLSIILSLCFSYTVHALNRAIAGSIPLTFIEVSTMLILHFALKKSKLKYNRGPGTSNLEDRFQTSDVYFWSQVLLPAAILENLFKHVASSIVWIMLFCFTPAEPMFHLLLHLYYNVICIYIIIYPVILIAWSRKIRALRKVNDVGYLHTLDGQRYRMVSIANDHFDMLRASWEGPQIQQ